MSEFINYYFDNWGVFIQVIVTFAALIFAFFAWRGLRKEERDRQKQINNLETIANHLVITRRNSIRPLLKIGRNLKSAGQIGITYEVINEGKKAYELTYNVAKCNEFEIPVHKTPKSVNLEHNKNIIISFEFIVQKITEPAIIHFWYQDEDGNEYKQIATYRENMDMGRFEFTIDEPILEIKSEI